MNEYNILKVNNEDYKVIIFSKSYETPLLYLEDISNELKAQNLSSCKVVFDMLLCRGNTSERYRSNIWWWTICKLIIQIYKSRQEEWT